MALFLTEAEAEKLGFIEPEKKKSKCRNVKTIIDDIKFDSKKEAHRYEELKLLKRAGEIIKFELQPEFVLLDGYTRNERKIRPIRYRADFKIWWMNGDVTVEDVKPDGYFRTEKYRLKKKMLMARYPDLKFNEV